MAQVKIAHNMGQETRIVRSVSEGMNPALGVKVAKYLPIKELKYQGSEHVPVVIYAGELVALDQWNQLVPANGGVATANGLTYSAVDVEYGVPRFDNAAAYGNGAAATAGLQVNLLANNVVGIAFTDYVSGAVADKFLNYELQQTAKTINTEYLYEFPLVSAAQIAAKQGELVIPDTLIPGAWRPVASADFTNGAACLITANNMVGKIMKIEKITDDLLQADKIIGAPGLNLHGTAETGGIANHLSGAQTGTRPDNSGPSTASSKYRAVILVRL